MIIDSHIHFGDWTQTVSPQDLYKKMLAEMDHDGIDAFNLCVCGNYAGRYGYFKQADALWFKFRQPHRVYVFGGLDMTGLFDGKAPITPFVDQLERLRKVGCDGLKLLTGKPDTRKMLGHALDSEVFEPVYAWCETHAFPMVWHIADPPEFWNRETTPLWARRNGWWYDDTHLPKAAIDAEALAVFRAHPRLRVALAHFGFLSDRLADAATLLDTYPGIYLDLAPGVEMLHNFTAAPDAARTFFSTYQHRILYGTDTGMDAHATSPERGWMVRHWLASTETFDVPDDPFMLPDDRTTITGIGLPEPILDNILGENFRRFVGSPTPRPLHLEALADMCRTLIASAKETGKTDPAAELLLEELAMQG